MDHIEHVAGLVGVEHVGLGPDFFKEVSDEINGPGPRTIYGGGDVVTYVPGLEGPAGLPLITEELVHRGWPEADIREVLGSGFHHVFTHELGVPAADR